MASSGGSSIAGSAARRSSTPPGLAENATRMIPIGGCSISQPSVASRISTAVGAAIGTSRIAPSW